MASTAKDKAHITHASAAAIDPQLVAFPSDKRPNACRSENPFVPGESSDGHLPLSAGDGQGEEETPARSAIVVSQPRASPSGVRSAKRSSGVRSTASLLSHCLGLRRRRRL